MVNLLIGDTRVKSMSQFLSKTNWHVECIFDNIDIFLENSYYDYGIDFFINEGPYEKIICCFKFKNKQDIEKFKSYIKNPDILFININYENEYYENFININLEPKLFENENYLNYEGKKYLSDFLVKNFKNH